MPEPFEKQHDFLVVVDSDGCVFDSMELKHKECFIPVTIRIWRLQPIARYARAASEFVNLYSAWRGLNRFPALMLTLDFLKDWPEVQLRNFNVPDTSAVRGWIAGESRLGNASLKKAYRESGDPTLGQALEWSIEVDASISEIVRDLTPFQSAAEALQDISTWADVLVSSTAPLQVLRRLWVENEIDDIPGAIWGEDAGSKEEHLQAASAGRYEPGKILVLGDSPVDLTAARACGARFFPVRPGAEEDSWRLFADQVAGAFQAGGYSGEQEAGFIAGFEELLPSTPPWKIRGAGA